MNATSSPVVQAIVELNAHFLAVPTCGGKKHNIKCLRISL